jgi:hypothetical protein
MKIAKIPKLLALLICLALFAGTLAACTEETKTDDDAPPAGNDVPAGEPPALPSGFVGVDFTNGNIDFMMMHFRPLDASPNARIELGEFRGVPAAKVTPDGSFAPYIAVDACSLLGDRISDVASIEVGMAVEHAGGFQAVQGEIVARYGEDLRTAKAPWSVFIDSRNPNSAVLELKEHERMVSGAYNMIIIDRNGSGASVGDNSVDAGGAPGILYVTYIGFKDSAGNWLPVNADVSFNEPHAFNENVVDFVIELGTEIGLDYGGMNCVNSSNPEHQVGWLTDDVDGIPSPYLSEEVSQAEMLILEFAQPPKGTVQLIWLGDGGGWRWTQVEIIHGGGDQTLFEIDLASTFDNYDGFKESEAIKILLGAFAYHVECGCGDPEACEECGDDGLVEFPLTIADLQLIRAELVVFE